MDRAGDVGVQGVRDGSDAGPRYGVMARGDVGEAGMETWAPVPRRKGLQGWDLGWGVGQKAFSLTGFS